ncbi:MAG: beta-N-acetylhexosaminidase [Chloroflexota bacterium]
MTTNLLNQIIPLPVEVKPQNGTFALDDETILVISPEMERMVPLAEQLLRLTAQPQTADRNRLITLSVNQEAVLQAEGYRLQIEPDHILLEGGSEAGVFYGLQTLRQLLPTDMMAGRTGPVEIPCGSVVDCPKFRWRAMHLDVGRHMFSVEFVKKYIDLLALHKMNIFHWHLTEDQGWRIEIEAYPKLMEVSAWRDETPLPQDRTVMDGKRYGGYYTKAEIREVVAYAHSRFVTVVPEIELPGHTVSVLAAYPELGCVGEGYKVRTEWGIEDDVFCAGNEAVFQFLEAVFDEVLELFPGQYIHIGGDECPKIRWQACDKCQDRIQAEGLRNEDELQSWFISRIGRYLDGKGRRLIGWDEILEGGIPPNAAVMSWRGTEGGIEAAQAGHEVVMSPTTHCYFDYYQTEAFESEPPAFYWPIPEAHRVPGGPTFSGLITLDRTYSFDPLEGVPDEHQAFVMGGQANLWSEYIPTSEQAEYQAYPRGSALAETLWSPQRAAERDLKDFIGRLATHLKRLDALNVNYRYPKEFDLN